MAGSTLAPPGGPALPYLERGELGGGWAAPALGLERRARSQRKRHWAVDKLQTSASDTAILMGQGSCERPYVKVLL